MHKGKEKNNGEKADILQKTFKTKSKKEGETIWF
jgi:hypothetical protein